jgi:hypothetical protein
MLPRFSEYRFPGRAGELYASGDETGFRREVALNYGTYHEALADTLERTGGRPDPAAHRGDFGGYARACNLGVEVLRAEMLIRAYRGAERGRSDPMEGRPLVDEAHRLVAVEGDDATRRGRRGSDEARRWTPPQIPAHLRE